ncbi:MAG: ribosomal RNA small subunit methyltransferase A, partial [Spirochaetia bacterium]
GNLPYNAAAPILWALLTAAEPIPRIVCTVQREVAERMVAAPRSRNFGPFAVLCSLEYHARIIRRLSGGCFYPRPHVESSAVLLTATGARLPVRREQVLRLTDAVFAQPRKTVSNNLKALAGTRENAARRLAAAHVSGDVRPSALSIDDVVNLSQAFEDLLAG